MKTHDPTSSAVQWLLNRCLLVQFLLILMDRRSRFPPAAFYVIMIVLFLLELASFLLYLKQGIFPFFVCPEFSIFYWHWRHTYIPLQGFLMTYMIALVLLRLIELGVSLFPARRAVFQATETGRNTMTVFNLLMMPLLSLMLLLFSIWTQ